MSDIDKSEYEHLILNPEIQVRVRRNLLHLMYESKLSITEYTEQYERLAGFLNIGYGYAEQAVHGRPVHRHFVLICRAFNVSEYDMLHENLAAVPA